MDFANLLFFLTHMTYDQNSSPSQSGSGVGLPPLPLMVNMSVNGSSVNMLVSVTGQWPSKH